MAPYPQMPMFHSRRIGQRPGRLAVPKGETVIERPGATTILGATKVTGKARGWSYGGLTALTDREYALVQKVVNGDVLVNSERLIEPYTSYNVARVQKDLAGGSTIGGSGSAVVREQDQDAYTGAIDYTPRSRRGERDRAHHLCLHARPRSFDFEPVVLDSNPDFNSKSVRGNVVFRWEYKRGSTLYLVWNVNNSDRARPGEFSAFRDFRSGFGAAGTQVFIVKLNYWLGL